MSRYLGSTLSVAALLFVATLGQAAAGYLDENPDEVFAGVYERLGALPLQAARDPFVWLRLQELKREPCDQKSIGDLALMLDKLGYRRQAAESQFRFVKECGAPLMALHRAADTYMKLTDYPRAVEVADEYVRRAPSNRDAHYLRATALAGAGDHQRALTDYSDTIELSPDKARVASRVFTQMAEAYAAMKRYCEAVAPISLWVSFDPVARDTSQTRRMIADYERQGNCVAPTEARNERFPLGRQKDVVVVKAEINGVKGSFILDTGASYVSVRSAFAERARLPLNAGSDITLMSANGETKARLSRADKVKLNSLLATGIPVAVQAGDQKDYGSGIDGLLGMSFLSRFDVQIAADFVEVRPHKARKP
ncbi:MULTISPECIES: aspartyl protease family protein [unclassified Bradyrhizobium]|uniref:aspartyl protease family protein n=1 Tax=unclassified Bradyrhizobium TaxID=2631580 RepID=UPI0028EAEAB9|nr:MULTISPECIES: aspartyl protease family protein [unclassified Bradyrhizobium]